VSQQCFAEEFVDSEVGLTLWQRIALSIRPRKMGRHVDDGGEALVDRYTRSTVLFSHTLVAVFGVFGQWISRAVFALARGFVVALRWCGRAICNVIRDTALGLGRFVVATARWSMLRWQARKPIEWRGLLGPAVMILILIGIGVVAVAPTRTYLSQQQQIRETIEQRETIARENALLQAQAQDLATPQEIERLARSEYGLVREGEQPFAILPGPNSVDASFGAVDPNLAPRADADPSTLSTVVDFLTFWS